MELSRGEIKLITGNANKDLAEKIAKALDMKIADSQVTHFSDGEINLNISETVRGQDVFIIQPTCSPVNDNLMEILILIDLNTLSLYLRLYLALKAYLLFPVVKR